MESEESNPIEMIRISAIIDAGLGTVNRDGNSGCRSWSLPYITIDWLTAGYSVFCSRTEE